MLKNKIPGHYKTIIRDSTGLLFADLLYRSSNVVTLWLVAHYLGPTSTGIYTLGSTIRATLQIATLGGTGYLIIRELSRNQVDAQQYLLNFTGLRLSLSICSWLLIWCIIPFLKLPYPKAGLIISILGLELVPESFREIIRSSSIAQQRVLPYTLTASFTGLARIITCWGVLSAGKGLLETVASIIFVSWVGNWLGLLKLLSISSWPHVSFAVMKMQTLASLPFLAINILLVIYAQSNVYLLSILSTMEEVAFYSIADSIVASSSLLTQVYLSLVIPTFSKLYSLDREQLGIAHSRSLLILSSLAFPIAGTISFQAGSIATLWGMGFHKASGVIGLLIWSLAVSWLNAPNSGIMIATGHEKISAKFLTLALGVNVIAGLIFVPLRGAIGAALARLMAELAFGLTHWLFVHRKVSRAPVSIIGLPLIAVITMGLARFVLGLLLKTWAAMAVSLVTYIGVLLIGLLFLRRR